MLLIPDGVKASDSIKYRSGYKYQTARDAFGFFEWLKGYTIETEYIMVEEGWIWIRQGYAWDGPSGPTFDTKSTMRGSLFHDAFYQLLRLELLPRELRHNADHALVDMCGEDGMWKIRQKWFLVGVEDFAAGAAHPDNARKVYTAP
jgi:hypothetical protein